MLGAQRLHSFQRLHAHFMLQTISGVRHGLRSAVKPPVQAFASHTTAVRLQVMDRHLSILALQHTETKFVKVSSSQDA